MAYAAPLDPGARKATRINLFSFVTAPMRAFHMTWLAFFICFFAWFAAAPLTPLIAREFGLTKPQVDQIAIGSVFATILVRIIIGPLCNRIGPRKTYVWLLLLGALPVFGLAFAQGFTSLLILRLLIGAIGASFVITQYHTSVMFAPNVVGTANAAVGGWGNAGGGVTQTVMPLILAGLVSFGVAQTLGWRIALMVPAVAMLVMAWAYWRFTQDCPQGNYSDMRAAGLEPEGGKKGGMAVFLSAMSNYRVWMLAAIYGGSFGVEIFIHNIAASYYVDNFKLSLEQAGLAAGTFGLLALFARAFGGMASDRTAGRFGLHGRAILLFGLMAAEGIGLLFFSQASTVTLAVTAMVGFGLFTHMACGATYALMPFIDRKALGGVAGIIGAGGNLGAVLAGFLKLSVGSTQTCLWILGIAITCISVCALTIRFSAAHQANEDQLYQAAIREREGMPGAAVPA